ncbi:hypothetical protein [Massilia antarctica]|uniref:hypothetical protein n=1 Tax=Massilia antarctica TaxID=2765360 RepID=UPI000B07D16E|nr:hypothetical protein [Massilia sp. H27-R4]MCY0913083.1 hypothetical protein [Massilia sp. H27-R4]
MEILAHSVIGDARRQTNSTDRHSFGVVVCCRVHSCGMRNLSQVIRLLANVVFLASGISLSTASVALGQTNHQCRRGPPPLRPALENCTSQLPAITQSFQLLATLQYKKNTGRTYLGIDLQKPSGTAQQFQADQLSNFKQCLAQVLDLPDPAQHCSSLTFGFGVKSQAPGLDASVHAAVDDNGERIAPSMPTLPLQFRKSADNCMRFINGTITQVELSFSYTPSATGAKLSGWTIRARDPRTLNGREGFQLHSRCMTGTLGTSQFLSEPSANSDYISAKSR